jgi:hypothetical protein
MDSDERDIFYYLQTWGHEYINAKEISRRAGTKKRYHQDPDWAKGILIRMVERGIAESDSLGRYRIKSQQKKDGHKRWVSPEITKILRDKGVQVEGAVDIGTEEYYDQL